MSLLGQKRTSLSAIAMSALGQKEPFRDRATCAAGKAFNHSIATKFSIFISPLYRCWTFHLEFLCIYLHISRSISSQLASA
jgi:hypothetical protein